MKKKKDYKLKKQADRNKGKFPCPACERRFKTALARHNHGVKMHGWKCLLPLTGDVG